MPKLIVISAPSGAGKTTLCARLLKDYSELTLSISSTTRAPRGTEKHGQEYFFLEKAEFVSQDFVNAVDTQCEVFAKRALELNNMTALAHKRASMGTVISVSQPTILVPQSCHHLGRKGHP